MEEERKKRKKKSIKESAAETERGEDTTRRKKKKNSHKPDRALEQDAEVQDEGGDGEEQVEEQVGEVDGKEDEAEQQEEDNRHPKKATPKVIPEVTHKARVKRPKKPKDTNAPRKPLNGFFRYLATHSAAVKRDNPGVNAQSFLGARWRNEPEHVKKPFEDEYQKAQEQYLKELSLYRKTEEYTAWQAECEALREAGGLASPIKKTKRTKRTKRKPVDPDKPKKPGSAFFRYMASDACKATHPGLKGKKLVEAAAKTWRSMTRSQRTPYEEAVAHDMKEFHELLAVYFEEHPELNKGNAKQKKVKSAKVETLFPPKPPVTARAVFIAEMLEKKPDHLSSIEHRAELAAQWKNLSDKEQQIYQDKVTLARARYRVEVLEIVQKMPEEQVAAVLLKALDDLVGMGLSEYLSITLCKDGDRIQSTLTSEQLPAPTSGTEINEEEPSDYGALWFPDDKKEGWDHLKTRFRELRRGEEVKQVLESMPDTVHASTVQSILRWTAMYKNKLYAFNKVTSKKLSKHMDRWRDSGAESTCRKLRVSPEILVAVQWSVEADDTDYGVTITKQAVLKGKDADRTEVLARVHTV